MTNQMQRETRYLSRLAECLAEEYGIAATSIVPAKRGYYGETWRVASETGSFFLKLDYTPRHQTLYRNSLEVVEYLCSSGIDFISKIVKTRSGDLCASFGSAVLGVFSWVDGENTETDETKPLEYRMLSKIYPLTKRGFSIPTVEFSGERAARFFAAWELRKAQPVREETDAMLAALERHRETLTRFSARLSHFSKLCRERMPQLYFTHGDAGGNLLVGNGGMHIVDWDEVMYAPLERDAWVMCCHDWALKAFRDALRQNRIAYDLRPERLAFYCYHMFFLYLGELLNDSATHDKQKEIEALFGGWIMERMDYADSV